VANDIWSWRRRADAVILEDRFDLDYVIRIAGEIGGAGVRGPLAALAAAALEEARSARSGDDDHAFRAARVAFRDLRAALACAANLPR